MKVFMIEEGTHGIIGVAATVTAAVEWLIGSEWIEDESYIWDNDKKEYFPILQYFGVETMDDLKKELLNKDDDEKICVLEQLEISLLEFELAIEGD